MPPRGSCVVGALAKLVRLEQEGPQVGQPLRGELHGFRKIVVGDRDWRIIFRTDAAETVATVWVIGDRAGCVRSTWSLPAL